MLLGTFPAASVTQWKMRSHKNHLGGRGLMVPGFAHAALHSLWLWPRWLWRNWSCARDAAVAGPVGLEPTTNAFSIVLLQLVPEDMTLEFSESKSEFRDYYVFSICHT
jgi:hypothetical protein